MTKQINLHDLNFLRDVLKYHISRMYNTCLDLDIIVRVRAEGNEVDLTLPSYDDLLEKILRLTPDPKMEHIKHSLYELVLDISGNHQEDAAEYLGVTPRTLRFHKRRREVEL